MLDVILIFHNSLLIKHNYYRVKLNYNNISAMSIVIFYLFYNFLKHDGQSNLEQKT